MTQMILASRSISPVKSSSPPLLPTPLMNPLPYSPPVPLERYEQDPLGQAGAGEKFGKDDVNHNGSSPDRLSALCLSLRSPIWIEGRSGRPGGEGALAIGSPDVWDLFQGSASCTSERIGRQVPGPTRALRRAISSQRGSSETRSFPRASTATSRAGQG